MTVRSTPVRAGAQAQPDGVLRRLRALSFALAIACAAMLPFAQGVVEPASLPLVGTYFAPPELAIVAVDNFPRTAVVGHTERFSVQLAGMPHAPVTYVLRYPDKRLVRAQVRSDAHGYSRYTFAITGYQPHSFREKALVGVLDAHGHLRAYKFFAIQKPSK